MMKSHWKWEYDVDRTPWSFNCFPSKILFQIARSSSSEGNSTSRWVDSTQLNRQLQGSYCILSARDILHVTSGNWVNRYNMYICICIYTQHLYIYIYIYYTISRLTKSLIEYWLKVFPTKQWAIAILRRKLLLGHDGKSFSPTVSTPDFYSLPPYAV